MKTLILILMITFSTTCFSLGPGVGGGGGLKVGEDFVIINGEIHIPIKLFNQNHIYSQLIQSWQLDKIKTIINNTVVIKDIVEVEYINSDYLLTNEVVQKTVIPAAFVRAIHLMNGEQIIMTPPITQYEETQAAQKTPYKCSLKKSHHTINPF